MSLSTLLIFPTQMTQQPRVEEFIVAKIFDPTTPTSLASNPDLHFLNTEDEPLQIEQVRQLTEQMAYKPYQSPLSIFVIFNIDKASIPAQNALLKSLEEPPEYVQLILTTNNLAKVLPTIQSRCVMKAMKPDKTSISEPTQDFSEPFNLLEELKAANYAALFALSEKYKERSDAKKLLENLLVALHQRNTQQPSQQLTQQLQKIVETQNQLDQNVNVRLALEELFLTLRNV